MPRAIQVLAAAAFVALAASPGNAQSDEMRTVPVAFAAGESATTIEDHISGKEGVAYGVTAASGQDLTVTLESANPSVYFDVLAPGTGHTLFAGARQGKHFEGKLPEAGDYTVRVLLAGSAARKNAAADYKLDVSLPEAAPGSGG